MPFKISPEELNPKTPPSELSLSLQRNEKLIKNAQRHIEHDNRAKYSREHTATRKHHHRRSSEKKENTENQRRGSKSEDKKEERKEPIGEDKPSGERRESRDKRKERKESIGEDKPSGERRGSKYEEKREERKEHRHEDKPIKPWGESKHKREERKEHRHEDKLLGESRDKREERKEHRREDKSLGESRDKREERKEPRREDKPLGEKKMNKPDERKANKMEEMKDEKEVKVSKNNEGVKLIPSTEEFSVTRLDAVVFVVVLAQVVGCLAVGFEIYAYSLDQEWNKILDGKNPIQEINNHNVFKQKTFKLEGHVYLKKAKEYARRNEPEEMVFIVLILLFVIASFIQICACYIKAIDVEQYTALLIGLYAFGGAMCMLSSTFLIIAAANIENSFTYAADMLYNYRLINTDTPIGSQDQDKCHGELKNGCDYYEFAKLQTVYLERIFRQCGSGSRFTRYYRSDTSKTAVEVFDETYFRSELKEIGFCSRDGYKFVAAACAVLMGMLCAIVPVIFCCQGSADGKRAALLGESSTDIRTSKDQPNEEQELGQEKKIRFDQTAQTAVFEEFRAYVEKDSGNEANQTTQLEDTKQP